VTKTSRRDGVLLKVYDDIQEELKVKTDVLKKAKQKVKALNIEIRDLQQEFEDDRTDYLDTIRKQDKQLILLQQILERVQPTIRKDTNYSNIDKIKEDAVWNDESQRWKIPDLVIQKTKLPPAAETCQKRGRGCRRELFQASQSYQVDGSSPRNPESHKCQQPAECKSAQHQDRAGRGSPQLIIQLWPEHVRVEQLVHERVRQWVQQQQSAEQSADWVPECQHLQPIQEGHSSVAGQWDSKFKQRVDEEAHTVGGSAQC